MFYKQIIATPVVTLNDMTYPQFVEMFTSCITEIELLEAAQSRERNTAAFITREHTINKLETAKTNLTYHRHYQAYCDAQDRKHYDSVYHRPLYG